MKSRKQVIQEVLNAFLGITSEEEMFDVVLDEDEIEILSTALDEALEKVEQ